MREAVNFMRIFRNKKRGIILADIIAIALMAAFAFYINRDIKVTGLYMDDLYLWSFYGEQSFWEFAFPATSVRFRPVFWAAAYIEYALIGTHLSLIVPINIILLILFAVYCYRFIVNVSESRLLAFLSSMAILGTRFSYYDVSQLMGLLEYLAMFLAVFICVQLFYYMHDKKEYHFILAVAAYLLVCFTHERYMVLIPMFYYVLIALKDKKVINYILPAVVLIAVITARYIFTGSILPAGTGGTDVADTFTIKSFFLNCKEEIMYLLGFNAGPEYLCGIEWANVAGFIKKSIYFGLLLMAFTAVVFVIKLLSSSKKGNAAWMGIRDVVFFGGFIIGCVAASSVTIRVEMRWIYTSFVILLFILAYMYGYIASTHNSGRSVVMLAAVGIICVLFIGEDAYYRSHWDNIYLFPNQSRYNSLADVTYGTYGEEILGKDIYIIGNSYEMSEFTGEYFFKTFDPEKKAEGTRVIHVESLNDIPADDDIIILKEDPENNAFVEVKREES